MAAFRDADVERFDWSLLKCGPVALFHRREVLDDAIEELRNERYKIATVECTADSSKVDLLAALYEALGFDLVPYPNLDGFNDYCWQLDVPDEGGFAVALFHFDRVVARDRELAENILDIFSGAAWDKLLFGRRFLCLVQSDDPEIDFPPLGGHVPWWNDREWLHKDRGL